MGAYQSSGDAPRICCLHLPSLRGTPAASAMMLVPLLPAYFPDEECSLFRALHTLRCDSETRYVYARPESDTCEALPPPVSQSAMYEHNVKRQGLQANTPHCMPLGCAVAMVVEPNADSDGMLLGHPVKILGRMACRNAIDETSPWEAGIFLHHQATEGQLKFVAVAAAAMYLKQSEGVDSPTRFRGVEFTTLQQNLSMLRGLLSVSQMVALGDGATQQRVQMKKRGNRYVVQMEREYIVAAAACLAGFAEEFAPSVEAGADVSFHQDGAMHFLLKPAALSLFSSTTSSKSTAGSDALRDQLDVGSLQLQYAAQEDAAFTIVRVYAPPALADAMPPDQLEDAVAFLQWIAETIEVRPSTIRPAADPSPEAMVLVLCFGCHNRSRKP